MSVALFSEHYDCEGGCEGTGHIPITEDGWCDPCPVCNPDGKPEYDPWLAPIPF
jgi:hypothetical protein